jgi:Aspartyl protease
LHSLEGRHDGRQVQLSLAVLASDNPTDLTFTKAQALLDTGSTVSGLGPRVIDKLGLDSYGKRLLGSATELRMVNYYFFRIGLFGIESGDLPYIFAELDGFGWPEHKGFDVILGMDVLSQCEFSMRRNGQWQLTFG